MRVDNKLKVLVLNLIGLFFLGGCTSVTYDAYNDYPRGKITNTSIYEKSHTNNIFDGYLIGIEKRPLSKIDDVNYTTCNNKHDRDETLDMFDKQNSKTLSAYSCIYRHVYKNTLNQNNPLDAYYKEKLSGSSTMMVSHIYNMQDKKPIYSAYNNIREEQMSFIKGYSALTNSFSTHLEKKLETGNYTHIFVTVMGWHNDQNISLQRINRLTANIKQINKNIKPLTLAVTWPSAWFAKSDYKNIEKIGHITSYPNKTNDADELGFTLLNTLVNQVVPLATKRSGKNIKQVLIGHSLGARMLSRAVFSQDYLKYKRNDVSVAQNTVDLLVGLQPAFSINRFNKKALQNPTYKNIYRKLPILLTSSYKDTSNNASKYLGVLNVGSEGGFEEAKKDNNTFCTTSWNPRKKEIIKNQCKRESKDKIMVVDVSSILDGCYTKDCVFKVDSHNDVFDIDMAHVINYGLNNMIN